MSDRDRFDKFTERARRVLHLAQEEAQRLQDSYIGVEHIWLGIVREGEGVGAKVLQYQGVNLQNMRNAVDAMKRDSEQSKSGELGLTSAGKQAIEQAVTEARRLNQHYIGTEHLLLGLVRQADKTTQEIFDNLGVKLEDISSQTMKILSQSGAMRQSAPVPQLQSRARDRFDRFSTQAMKVVSFAQEEAQRFQHNYIGTEHLLLGLLRQTDGLACQLLNSLGVELDKARSALEFIIGRGERIMLGEISMTPRAKKIIELANEEADLLESPAVETEHLLLGMIREGNSVAIAVLESLGVSKAKVYIQTLRILLLDSGAGQAFSPGP
jgi:ATP-dependent Clp protease ATP-binding subunit ClpA